MGKPSNAAAVREARLPSGAWGRALAVAARPVAVAARLAPYRQRVRVILRLSLPLTWLARMLGRRRLASGLGVRERIIGRLLSLLHYRGVPYPADISVTGDAPLSGPLLLVVRHSLVNQLLISRLVEDGRPVTLVMTHLEGHARTFGIGAPLDVLQPAPMVLRDLARRLEAGRLVVVALDAMQPMPGFTRVETPAGPWYLSVQPLRLAVRLRVPIAVAVLDIQHTRIVAGIRRLPDADVADALSAYCDAYRCR